MIEDVSGQPYEGSNACSICGIRLWNQMKRGHEHYLKGEFISVDLDVLVVHVCYGCAIRILTNWVGLEKVRFQNA